MNTWIIKNGSGWNRHKTAEVLSDLDLPEPPEGYRVCVAPVSDKPFGLRTALLRILPRRLTPVIGLLDANRRPIGGDRIRAIHDGEPSDMDTLDKAIAYLATLGFTKRHGANCIHTDGTIATVEMFDDGVEDEDAVDSWAWNNFRIEAERIFSHLTEQQYADESAQIVKEIKYQIATTAAK